MPQLALALAEHGRAILTASPGSGKTTRVPLALLGLLPGFAFPAEQAAPPLAGKILVLEPRRLAARSAARYMARLLGEDVGQRVGYRVRLESKVSAQTRVELLTEGMFTRRLLADPELSGVSCVIFDEFHERSLQTDLGLALCLESMEALRPDLRLLIMSATLDAGEISRFLSGSPSALPGDSLGDSHGNNSGGCPVIEAEGRNWPVDVRYAGKELAVAPGDSAGDIAGKTAAAVRNALHSEPGNILVFLPGQAEIKRAAELLENRPPDTDIYPLYGDLPPREQDAALAPPPPGRRKVVLATDIAQTSLTIEGVRVVIDAGLARGPRFEPATSLSRLTTTRLARDAADQRAGRAGRLEPGLCLRLWPERETLLPQTRPEIMDADLAPLCLDALAWGSQPEILPWLTPPPEAALRNAAETLLALDAVRAVPHDKTPGKTDDKTDNKRGDRLAITPRGLHLARLPLHPRLASMVLHAADPATGLEEDLSSLAACLAALVSERDPLRRAAGESEADIRLRLPLVRRPENKRIRDAAAQIHRLSGLQSAFALPGPAVEDFCGMLLSLAWPERIAQNRGPGSFRLASGQGAELPPHDPLASAPWLAVASLGGTVGGRLGGSVGGGVNRRVHLAAPVTLADIVRLHGERVHSEEEVFWDSRNEAVVCRSIMRLDALILEEAPLAPSPELRGRVQQALLHGIVSLGLPCLPWTDDLRQLQARVALARSLEQAEPENTPWPDMRDAALLDGLAGKGEFVWLSPWLEGITRRAQFAGIDLGAALRSLLPWPLPERLEAAAPARLALPSGSSAMVDYLPVLRGEPPVLAVKLQEMFGQTDTPRVGRGRVPVMLHLLSPAGRPLQVTGDLRHFWANAYKAVRAEMRGRYPKHPWPEDPLSAIPTGKTKRRLAALSGG